MLLTDCQEEREWLVWLPLGLCRMCIRTKVSCILNKAQRGRSKEKSNHCLDQERNSEWLGSAWVSNNSPTICGRPSELFIVPFHLDSGSLLTPYVTDPSRGRSFYLTAHGSHFFSGLPCPVEGTEVLMRKQSTDWAIRQGWDSPAWRTPQIQLDFKKMHIGDRN